MQTSCHHIPRIRENFKFQSAWSYLFTLAKDEELSNYTISVAVKDVFEHANLQYLLSQTLQKALKPGHMKYVYFLFCLKKIYVSI